MRKPEWKSKVLAVVCLVALCVCTLPLTAFATDTQDLEAEIERLRSELNTIQGNIASIEGDIAASAQAKEYYRQQQATLEELLALNQASMSETETEIMQKQLEIGQKIQSVHAQQELFEERMVAMYKNRNENVLSTLLSVNSFSELLTVSNSLQRITQHDTELIETLSREKEELELERQELERLVEELDKKNTEHENGIQQLAGSIAAQDATISDLEAQKTAEEVVGSEKQDELAAAEKEHAEQQELARQMAEEARQAEIKRQAEEDERRRQEEERQNQQNQQNEGEEGGEGAEGEDGEGAQDGGSTPEPEPEPPAPEVPQHNGSVYLWPVPGHSGTTTEFGSPDPGGKGHRGLDINDGSIRGASIVAAGPGTVLRAGWHSSYGNYVSIDHGGGLVTLYAHMEGYTVGAGQYVEAGALLGYVGNTGYVFGANGGYHLHFEVQVNGVCQNPRNYVAP